MDTGMISGHFARRFVFSFFTVWLLFFILAVSADAGPQVTSGEFHSAALRQDGTVLAWGANSFGQLGDGSTAGTNRPGMVPALDGVRAIAAGGSHMMALMADGTIRTWGHNQDGQLGDGTLENRLAPVQLTDLDGVIALAAGAGHTVALKGDGTVWAWGNNDTGQLGDGTTGNRLVPVQVSALDGVIALAAGAYHTVALQGDGTVWAWGKNQAGQLGDGTLENRWTPVQVPDLGNVTSLAAGADHTVALIHDDTVRAWGNNDNGQLGDGTYDAHPSPVQVAGLDNVIAIAAGWSHTAALKRDGTFWCWGRNHHGQLGDGTNTDQNKPVAADNLTQVTAIGTGYHQSFARKRDGTVWAWGHNAQGQLGNQATSDAGRPVPVAGLLLTALQGDITGDTAVTLSDTYPVLQVLSGMSPSDMRSDFVTSDTDVRGDRRAGLADAIHILGSISHAPYDNNTAQRTIPGPGGSSLRTPAGGLNGGTAVSLTGTADDSGLVVNNERRVSEVLTITTSSDDAVFGDGTFVVEIPLDGSAVTDPEKLLLKVMLNNGASYSLLGTFDAGAGLYRAALSGIINGWKIAVVEDPSVRIIRVPRPEVSISDHSRTPMAWLTSLDWKTFEWAVVNHTGMTDEEIATHIMPELWGASEALAYAGFRSPKIYIDPRLSPPARVCHLIDSNYNGGGSHFHAGFIQLEDGSWTYTEDDDSYSTLLRDHDELSALGQIYVNHEQFVRLNQDYGVTLGNIVIHELFHAVQYGYDVRKLRKSMAAYLEGTATPLGQTYQDTGSITGPSVSVRVLRPNEHARLYQAVDDPASPLHYTKQDFFTYVSKRYGGNSFAWTDQLFEYMSIRTANRFGLTAAQYRTLYREAMDELFTEKFGRGLPVIFREYALDRAYEHNPDYFLRPDEEIPANGFGPNQLARTLFQWNAADTKGFKPFDPKTAGAISFTSIEPLSCVAVSMDLPGQADPENPVGLPLQVTLTQGDILPEENIGIKIIAFLENADGTMVLNGRHDITDISDTVMLPYQGDAASVTVLIMNCYLESRDVGVTVSAGPYIDGISTASAQPGDTITITGFSFGADRETGNLYLDENEVRDIAAWNNTRIEFTLPDNAESDRIEVVVDGTGSNAVRLEVRIPDPYECTPCTFQVNYDELEMKEIETTDESNGFYYVKKDTDINHGPYQLWYDAEKSKLKTCRCFKDDLSDGRWAEWYENGNQHWERNYKNGVSHGKDVYWDNDGFKSREGTYKDGKHDGLWISWWWKSENKSWERTYRDGKLSGLWTKWWYNGNMKEQGIYLDGEWDGTNGVRDGLWIHWYVNGNKELEGNWNNGIREGEWTKWYDNGNKESEGRYEDDSRRGVWWWYNESDGSCRIGENYGDIGVRLNYVQCP